jgi:superfamily II DNA or RNA helicase
MTAFSVGSLVRTRGREWVVLPESIDDLLVLRPLGGTDDEVAGVYLPLERVEAASFAPPSPEWLGDDRACRLLRDAIRLGFRSSAGPFRSFGRISVEPRPYQLVPLLMALRLDPVRLLIADDVGVGKSVEAALIAREFLDRGEIKRLAVLCPPHLAEQWQNELATKFHLDAELVLPSTVTRLERACAVNQSLFEVYPFVVVSTDFIKADRRREDFLRACPEMVLVDEAHTCVTALEGRSTRHQRAQLLRGLAADATRHLILVTATPHSGKDEEFRALLALLDPSFAQLPDDLSGPRNEPLRRQLARHFVQRRRADIEHYLQTDTPFPKRAEDIEKGYTLSPEYRRLFDRVLAYARETVVDPTGNRHRQRIRWWSALALLRSLASSPAAAAATLRERAAPADTETEDEADEIGRRTVLDLEEAEGSEAGDVAPGSEIGEHAGDADRHRRRLLDLAREADALSGAKDAKLHEVLALVGELVRAGRQPIVFCRFIPTAEYVARHLRDRLRDVTVEAVTGLLPPAEREQRVAALGQSRRRVLVCTDCLSEGINLQDHFDAVVHYDLSWNPTRHEQREGRVDRYGQPRPTVQMATIYGRDTRIDGIVLDVLLRKHQRIRRSLGVSVPIPVDTTQLIEAIFEGLLLRGGGEPAQLVFEEFLRPQREDLTRQWDAAADRQRRSRTVFAQEAIRVEEVARELSEARAAVGSGVDVAAFVREALRAHGATVTDGDPARIDLAGAPTALRDALPLGDIGTTFEARFELPVAEGVVHLGRTHPVVEALASYVMTSALDPALDGVARRAGAIRTRAVALRTTLLLVRFRYHLLGSGRAGEVPLLAEDCQVLAFEGAPDQARWLDSDRGEALLRATPDANLLPEAGREAVRRVGEGLTHLQPRLDDAARVRGSALLDAHRRVRQSVGGRVRGLRVEPILPADLLGVYVLLPAGA